MSDREMKAQLMLRRSAVVTLLAGTSLGAQDSIAGRAARAGPPVRQIATASAISSIAFGSLTDVVELPGNRVLVNDGQRRQLLLLDTTLALVHVVLDSVSETENTYGSRAGALIPYRGDSSLFMDPTSLALLVLDPAAAVARVRSVPRVEDVRHIVNRSGGFGRAGTDARGRIVYRVPARAARPRGRLPRGVPYVPSEPDSAFIVAIDLDTRHVDTLGSIRIPRSEFIVRMTPTGRYDISQATNPLPMTDEWAVLSDGTIAFVRGIDYRIEYLHGDGEWTSSAKLPFDWQPLSDEARERLVDSLRSTLARNARISYTTALIRWVNQYGKGRYPEGFTAPEGYRAPQGFGRDWALPPGVRLAPGYIFACAAGEEPVGGERPSCIPAPVPNPDPPPAPRLREPAVISARLLPDFRPPFAVGAVRADADGNLWIRTNRPGRASGGAIYDVVNRSGELADRLQLPTGYQVVGFGAGKVVYLAVRDSGQVRLARVRLR